MMDEYQFTDSNSVTWRKSTVAVGVEVKDLGKADGREMQLVRFARLGQPGVCTVGDIACIE
jgi:hypothetical protein